MLSKVTKLRIRINTRRRAQGSKAAHYAYRGMIGRLWYSMRMTASKHTPETQRNQIQQDYAELFREITTHRRRHGLRNFTLPKDADGSFVLKAVGTIHQKLRVVLEPPKKEEQ